MHSRWLGVSTSIAAAALALSGCGGGDGNGSGSLTVLDKWQRYAAGNPTLDMTSEEIEDAWLSTSRRATHYAYLGGSVTSPSPGDDDPGDNVQVEVVAEELEAGIPDIEFNFDPVMEHNGIPVAKLKYQLIFEDDIDEGGDPDERLVTIRADVLSYGAWLDYTDFRVNFLRGCELGATGCSGTNPDYEDAEVHGYMAGRYSAMNPSGIGSATWAGVMVGMESPEYGTPEHRALLQGQPDVFLGDARIAIQDLAAPDVDVSFTNIHNVTEGTRRPDMTWEDLSLEDGLFGSASGHRDYIVGMFNGPRQQEVGGEFERGGIAGAFGAKRR